jgi:hypothetical protein
VVLPVTQHRQTQIKAQKLAERLDSNGGTTVKSFWIGCFGVCAIAMPIFAQPQAGAYQAGKIVGVDRLSAHQPAAGHQTVGSTDTPLEADVQNYNVSIQVGDTVYVCRYQAHSGQEMSWLQNKDVQVRVTGKTMYVKRATGEDAKATVLQSKKTTQP